MTGTEPLDEAVAARLRQRLAAQAGRAVVPPDLVAAIGRRHDHLVRRRTAARLLGAGMACVLVVGAVFGLARMGGRDVVEVAADGGPDPSLGVELRPPTRCDGEAGAAPALASTEAILWLDLAVEAAELGRIEAELAASPVVTDHRYVDRDETYDEFVDHFADQPEVIDLVGPEQLPTSFRIDSTDATALVWLTDLPGVDELELADPGCDRRDG